MTEFDRWVILSILAVAMFFLILHRNTSVDQKIQELERTTIVQPCPQPGPMPEARLE